MNKKRQPTLEELRLALAQDVKLLRALGWLSVACALVSCTLQLWVLCGSVR